jgi:hypothetical protein
MLDDLTPLSDEERRIALRAVAAIYRDAVAYALRPDGTIQQAADHRALMRIGSRLHWFSLGAFVGGFVMFWVALVLLRVAGS